MLQNIHSENVKLNINIIVAFCKTRGIGINNNLPWKLKSDMLKFKRLTIGNGNNAVIMGKNTWESIPNRPLSMRDNLVLSKSLSFENKIYSEVSQKNYTNKTFTNIDDVINYCIPASYDNIWIIGGESIYKTFLDSNLVNKIYVTYIDNDYTCDTFFPEIDFEKYRYIEQTKHEFENKSLNNDSSNDNKFNIYNRVYKKNII